jgi:hypothetical protein
MTVTFLTANPHSYYRTLHERQANHGKEGREFKCGLEGCSLLFDRFLL